MPVPVKSDPLAIRDKRSRLGISADVQRHKNPWRGFREEDLAGPLLMALAGPSLFL